jgi:transposase
MRIGPSLPFFVYGKDHVALLVKLEQQLVSKRRGKLPQRILFLQDNAAPHSAGITDQKLAELHIEVPKHPACSPDLSPSDYYLFPNLKKHLKGRRISSIEEAHISCRRAVCSKSKKEFFLDGLKKLKQRNHKCV